MPAAERLIRASRGRRQVKVMTIWPRYPKIVEMNTWVWLSELSEQSARAIDLGRVPSMDWDAIAGLGFDAVLD